MKTEKEKLEAKSVAQLKTYAKRVGVNLIDPKTGKAKTKVQLINGIIMLQRLGKAKKEIASVVKKQASKKTATASRQTKMRGRDIAKDIERKAQAPGKRTSASGKKYYERRANRSDVPGTMLGAKTVKAVTPQDYAKRKKAEVQAWYKACVGDKPIAGLLALTFDKKAGVYGNPEILIVIYRLPKKTAKGSTYSHYVGAIRQSYGNGINDIEKYLTPVQFNKFYENTSRRTLDTGTFNEMAKRDNVIYS